MQSWFRQIYSCFASLRATRPAVYFHSWYFMNAWIFSSVFPSPLPPPPSNTYLFPLSVCPSCWWIQMQQLWSYLELRLIFSERILKVHFPPMCLQLLIFLSDWSHNCLNKDGHYLPSVFATGNEANCPQGRKWLPISGDIDDDLRKDESKVSYSLLRGSLWHPSFWESK